MDSLHSFLSHLSRQGFGYYWIKLPSGEKQTIWFDQGEIPDLPPDGDVYFGVNPAKARRGGVQRARIEDISALNSIFAEFDAKDYGGNKTLALQRIDGLKLQPSVIVSSGGGYHCYWLLADPRPVFDSKELAHLRDIQGRWVEFVGGDKASKDIARVLRVPGTYNYKYDPPAEVLFLRVDMGQLYYLEDFVNLLPKPSPAIEPPPAAGGEEPGGQRFEPNVDRWLKEAVTLSHGTSSGRTDNAFWLGCQLRDDRVPLSIAEKVMTDYSSKVSGLGNHPFTTSEGLFQLKRAYNSSPREPAKNLSRPAPAVRVNGNGHHPTAAAVMDLPEEPPLPEEWTTARPDPGQAPTQAPADTVENNDTGQLQQAEEFRMGTLPKLEYLSSIPEIRKGLELQEVGDADILTKLFSGKIVYDHSEKKWYLWKTHFWEEDRTGYVYQLIARGVAPQYLYAAAELLKGGLDKVSEELVKRAAALRNKKRMDNVLYLAARHPEMSITGEEWDANPWVLGCPNGVVDLKTGEIRPGRPEDFIRSHTVTEWKGLRENCDHWVKFLLEVMNNDFEMVCYLQRLFGYGITGLRAEHIFPVLWGAEGRNGKGTILETLAAVLGKMIASPTDAESLMASNNKGNTAQPFLHDLRGMRLVWASETERGARIDSSLVKRLTGGDTIKARTLYTNPIEFVPTHMILMLTNFRPHINASDPAIWDRVKLIEFSQRFVDNPQAPNEHPKDKFLEEKLLTEAPGILAWLVLGCLEWQDRGFAQPKQVEVSTSAYREEEDITGMFITDRCDVGKTEIVKASQLYAAYSAWCKESGFTAMSLSTFGQEIHKKFDRKREKYGQVYLGIGLKDPIQMQKEIPF